MSFYLLQVDYFDNICDYKITVNMSAENKMIEMSPIQAVHKQLNGIKGIIIQ